MAVAGKTEVQRQLGDIFRAASQSFQRHAQAQLCQVAMHRNTGLLLKDPGKIKRSRIYRPAHIIKSYAFAHPGREIILCRFGALSMVSLSFAPAMAGRHSVLFVGGFQNVGHQLYRGDISPKMFQRFVNIFQPRYQFAMPPEGLAIAGPRHERKRIVGTIVYRRVQFAHDIFQNSRREMKDRSAIATIRRVVYAVSRVSGKEYGLVFGGRGVLTSEMLAKGAVTHQHYSIAGIVLFGLRPALLDPAVVIAHTDKRALVESCKGKLLVRRVRHYYIRLF